MARGFRSSTEERLEDSNIDRVIEYLATKGSTKKVACNMLNIAYNTARLEKIIATHLEKQETEARRRSEKRGKPATPEEISFVISEYLSGSSYDAISKSIYRGVSFVKSILQKYSVPERNLTHDYARPKLIPDAAVRERFSVGETVYSARYDTLAVVKSELEQNGVYIYSIWLKGDWQRYAYQPWYELASLESIKDMGVVL